MRKLSIICLSLLSLFALVACSPEPKDKGTTETPKVEEKDSNNNVAEKDKGEKNVEEQANATETKEINVNAYLEELMTNQEDRAFSYDKETNIKETILNDTMSESQVKSQITYNNKTLEVIKDQVDEESVKNVYYLLEDNKLSKINEIQIEDEAETDTEMMVARTDMDTTITSLGLFSDSTKDLETIVNTEDLKWELDENLSSGDDQVYISENKINNMGKGLVIEGVEVKESNLSSKLTMTINKETEEIKSFEIDQRILAQVNVPTEEDKDGGEEGEYEYVRKVNYTNFKFEGIPEVQIPKEIMKKAQEFDGIEE